MPKITQLSPEDLARWRVASAEKELVDLSFPGMSVDEARRGLLTYYKVLNDIFADYDLPYDEAGIFVSPVDGGIYKVVSVEFN